MGFYVTEPFIETDHRDTAAELPVCQSRLNRKTHISGSRGRGMFLKDHLGSVLALVDGAGNIVESYRYDAWGRTTVYGASNQQLNNSAIGNRYCWQGREYSFKTGLYYFRARWADPVTGRWLSPDPLGIAGGFNQYAMMGDNAVNFKDPWGLYGTDVHFELTKKWAQSACIDPSTANAIAAADEGTDYGPTDPIRGGAKARTVHFMQYGGNDARPMLNRLAKQWADSGDVERFGRVLHMLQDTYAHEGYEPVRGHAWDSLRGRSPDVWDPNSVRDKAAMNDTKDLLNYWRDHNKKQSCAK